MINGHLRALTLRFSRVQIRRNLQAVLVKKVLSQVHRTAGYQSILAMGPSERKQNYHRDWFHLTCIFWAQTV
jgi:hypothetical protein